MPTIKITDENFESEVIKARLEEMQHKVYVEVQIQQCYDSTGEAPIKVHWIDINKEDEENREYRSRLVANEIKTDKRLDLFAATPPLEANESLFRFAVTEGIGFQSGDRRGGNKIYVVDIKYTRFNNGEIIFIKFKMICKQNIHINFHVKYSCCHYNTF